ncbi:MAG: hypothetical protein KDB27_06555 [Planctomycetales bacterium]|nr:hypothetical protein [Planctomycetales bacterium]
MRWLFIGFIVVLAAIWCACFVSSFATIINRRPGEDLFKHGGNPWNYLLAPEDLTDEGKKYRIVCITCFFLFFLIGLSLIIASKIFDFELA